jgi:hypothetical protein
MESQRHDEAADGRWDALADELAACSAPGFRKAYLSHFLASGRRFAAAGNARGAQYCLEKLSDGLRRHAAADAMPAGGLSDARPEPPLDRLRGRWREERVRTAENLLSRHARRLSPLESKSYREKLAKLQTAAGQVGGDLSRQARRSDEALLNLRRRLYGRILQSQQAALGLGRAAAWLRPESGEPGTDRLVGPYNDRHNLVGLLEYIAGLDAAWVEEYLAHYRDLFRLKGMFADLLRPATR